MDFIATFPSSHAALRAEQACRAGGLAVELIPLPSQIRSDCGFCLLADGGADESEAASRLSALRAAGALELFRVRVTRSSSRKVKSYERCP